MNCPNCGGELAYAGAEAQSDFMVQHYKCLVCQKEFVQEVGGNFRGQLTELVEVREVEPELIPEELEE